MREQVVIALTALALVGGLLGLTHLVALYADWLCKTGRAVCGG
jgi:hypothetical protein